MKTVAVLLLCANGLIWPAAINGLCRGGVTTIVKQQILIKAKAVQWWI